VDRLFACLAALTLAAGSLPADGRGPSRDAFRDAATVPTLEGEWEVVSVLHGGESGNERDTRITIRDGRMAVQERGARRKEEYGYRLPRAHTPAGAIDLVVTEGPQKGQVFPGIYRAEGNALRLCVRPEPGAARPAALAAPKGSPDVLITLRRAGR
jgi:uncharacterized protein (TIGR03067 family)